MKRLLSFLGVALAAAFLANTIPADATLRGITHPAPGQLPGTATNDSASAGNVGELLSATVSGGAPISLTSGTPANLGNISLTAGDWDVSCNAVFTTAGTTTLSTLIVSLSTTSITVSAAPGNLAEINWSTFTPGASNFALNVGPTQQLVSGPTTVYCVLNSTFGTSTLNTYGRLRARRVR